jgi:hypothetical protein
VSDARNGDVDGQHKADHDEKTQRYDFMFMQMGLVSP